jgi:alcohol dehydrogenase
MWEEAVSVNEVREIRSRSIVYLGAGAIEKIDYIAGELKKLGVDNVIVVSGRGSYKKTGAWDYVEAALKGHGISYVLYDKVTPNPTVDSVDEATKIGKDAGAKGVIAIGGGSPIDAGKSVAVLLSYPENNARDLYELKFTPEKAAPIVAINLTHGTGTEADRFAVVSIPEKEYKPAIAYDCLYPIYSIDDPALMTKLSPSQTRYVSVDAVNHVIEAATTKLSSPYSILLAEETVRLVSKYLPKALENPDDVTARYYLLYASMIAGISFDNGLLHFTHALEHPLSAVKPDLSHGLGLAMILPAVIKTIYPASSSVLASVLAPIVPGLQGVPEEAEKAAKGVEKWLFSIGVSSKLEDEGFSDGDIEKLVNLASTTPSLDGLLSIAPVESSKELIAAIYRESLRPYNS